VRIGKYVLKRSFIILGLVATPSAVVTRLLPTKLMF
jgi:hypothetical protein